MRMHRAELFLFPIGALLLVGAGYLLFFPFALSNKVDVLRKSGTDFRSTHVFNYFWRPALELHDCWELYRTYNHARLKSRPNYDEVSWFIQ